MDSKKRIKHDKALHETTKTKTDNESCNHDWQMLDLGTGDYVSYYCQKCCSFKRDLED